MDPIEEIVESIDSANGIDMDNALVDDQGNVIRYFDRDNNKVFIRKNSSEDHSPAETDAGDKTDPNENTGEGLDPDKDDLTDDLDDDEAEYENPLDYVMKRNGYKSDKIKVGDEEKLIANLTVEEQLHYMVEEYDAKVDALEAALTEASSKAPELHFADPVAQQIVDALKAGVDPKQLAKEIITQDPAAQAELLTDEEVVALSFKKMYPKFTDQDIKDEIKDLDAAKLARRAKAFREEMKTMAPTYEHLTEAQKAENLKRENARQAGFLEETKKLKSTIASTKEIAGIQLNDQIKSFLVSATVPADADSDSPFVLEIANNPGKLTRLQFLDKYHEQIVEMRVKQAMEEGIRRGQSGKEKLSDEPLRTYGAVTPKDKVVQTKLAAQASKDISKMSEKEFSEWLQSSNSME